MKLCPFMNLSQIYQKLGKKEVFVFCLYFIEWKNFLLKVVNFRPKKYFCFHASRWRKNFSSWQLENFFVLLVFISRALIRLYPASIVLFDNQRHFGNWIVNCLHFLNYLIQVVVMLWNIFSFLHSKLKQTLNCLLYGFLIMHFFVFFISFVFVWRKCERIGNKDFVKKINFC